MLEACFFTFCTFREVAVLPIVFKKYTKEKKKQQEELSILALSYKNERQKFLELQKKYQDSCSKNDVVDSVVGNINMMVDNFKMALKTRSITLEDKKEMSRRNASIISEANTFLQRYLLFKKIEKKDFEEAQSIAGRAICNSEYSFRIYLKDTFN